MVALLKADLSDPVRSPPLGQLAQFSQLMGSSSRMTKDRFRLLAVLIVLVLLALIDGLALFFWLWCCAF